MVKGVQVFPESFIVFSQLIVIQKRCVMDVEQCKFAKLLTDLSGAMDEQRCHSDVKDTEYKPCCCYHCDD